jgi:hypothetical protein
MTQRRQALRQGKTAATAAFSIILAFLCTSPSISAQAEPVTSQAIPSMEALPVLSTGMGQATLIAALLVVLSTSVSWRYHRRDHTSPRRIGRRI